MILNAIAILLALCTIIPYFKNKNIIDSIINGNLISYYSYLDLYYQGNTTMDILKFDKFILSGKKYQHLNPYIVYPHIAYINRFKRVQTVSSIVGGFISLAEVCPPMTDEFVFIDDISGRQYYSYRVLVFESNRDFIIHSRIIYKVSNILNIPIVVVQSGLKSIGLYSNVNNRGISLTLYSNKAYQQIYDILYKNRED